VNVDFTQAITRARENPSEAPRAWETALGEFTKVIKRLGGNEKLVLHPGLDDKEYGRRRLLVMLLGFVLAYARDDGDGSQQSRSNTSSVRATAASLYYDANVPNAEARKWLPPVLAVVRLYEQLKLLDAHFSKDDPRSLFYDPLVSARAASVYFRHFGSFRRSTALLEETLERAVLWRKKWGHHLMLSDKYLGHRLAENYWAAYNLEGRNQKDLAAGRDRARQALHAAAPDADPNTSQQTIAQLDQKLAAHVLTMALYDHVGRYRGERLIGQARWTVLRDVRTELADVWEVLTSNLSDRTRVTNSSLRLQGRALLIACEASMTHDKQDIEIRLGEARIDARAARKHAADRELERRGGVLPFHEEVAREVEEYIFSLSFQDRYVDAIRFEPPPPKRARKVKIAGHVAAARTRRRRKGPRRGPRA
jgi:hypothetical protein